MGFVKRNKSNPCCLSIVCALHSRSARIGTVHRVINPPKWIRLMTLPNLTKLRFHLIIVVLGILFFIQGYLSQNSKSLTWDEPVFLASGYTYLTRNDFRLNPEAPPLMQQLAALPLLFLDLNVPGRNDPSWRTGDHFGFARSFIDMNANRIETITTLARLPILIIGAAFIVLFGSWGFKLFGPWPALGATTLAACSPNLLAHARLSTTDFGCAALMFAAVYACWAALDNGRRRAWAICGLTTGLALLTKYTALLLGPIIVILALMHIHRNPGTTLRIFAGLTVAAIVSILIVCAGYNLSFNPLLYLSGLKRVYSTGAPGYQYYLLGETSQSPWWYYHLITFFLKTPVPILILICTAAAAFLIRTEDRASASFLIVPAMVMMFVACFDQTNLGFRRILPAVPFLLLLTGLVPTAFRSRVAKRVYPALVLLSVGTSASAFPHYLSYFNEIAGGPDRGPFLLDDSNVDWGQDLPALAQWQKNHSEVGRLKLMYFGNVRPEHYGIRSIPIPEQDIRFPRPGYYAISAHNLAWLRKTKARTGEDIDWLSKYEPVFRAGNSIYVYQFSKSQ